MYPRRSSRMRSFVAAAATVFAGVIAWAAPQQPAAGGRQPVQDPIDYNWDVRPILSENCFQCHGPDEKAQRPVCWFRTRVAPSA